MVVSTNPMTLVEYAKTVDDPVQRGIIEIFPQELDFMRLLPMLTAPGGAYRYQEEGALPDNVAFRAINEVPKEGFGLLTDRVDQTYPLAGNLDVDRVLIDRYGPSRRAYEERMQIKAKVKKFADTFMAGDNQSNPREFTGLKARLRAVGTGTASVDGSNYQSRVIANSTASGGGPLSLAMLDAAIGLVDGANAIIMPKALKDKFPAAVRDTSVGGVYTQDRDDMGKPVPRYNGIEIYTGYGLSPWGEFLPFNEVAYGGGAAVTSSIYIVKFGVDGVAGIQTKPMEVKDFGLMEDGTWYRTNVHHDVGITIAGGYSAIRLTSITRSAIVK